MWWYTVWLRFTKMPCVCVSLWVCVYKYGSRDNRTRLILSDVFQTAQLSCLMWKTFTRFIVLLLKTWPQLCPLHCATVCPEPKLLILLNCGSYKEYKSYFLSRYHKLYFFSLLPFFPSLETTPISELMFIHSLRWVWLPSHSEDRFQSVQELVALITTTYLKYRRFDMMTDTGLLLKHFL